MVRRVSTLTRSHLRSYLDRQLHSSIDSDVRMKAKSCTGRRFHLAMHAERRQSKGMSNLHDKRAMRAMFRGLAIKAISSSSIVRLCF
jgi:hypothetical protein